MSSDVAGWTWPTPEARKCHYFDADEMRSLCGRYMLFRRDPRQMHPDEGKSRDDCAACRKALDKRSESVPRAPDEGARHE